MTRSTNRPLPTTVYLPQTINALLGELDTYIDNAVDIARLKYIRANLTARGDDANSLAAYHKGRLNWLLAKKNEIALAQLRLELEYELDDLEGELYEVATPATPVAPPAVVKPSFEETPLF